MRLTLCLEAETRLSGCRVPESGASTVGQPLMIQEPVYTAVHERGTECKRESGIDLGRLARDWSGGGAIIFASGSEGRLQLSEGVSPGGEASCRAWPR